MFLQNENHNEKCVSKNFNAESESLKLSSRKENLDYSFLGISLMRSLCSPESMYETSMDFSSQMVIKNDKSGENGSWLQITGARY